MKKPTKAKKRLVSFDADIALVARLDAAARETHVSRSWIIRAVLSGWLDARKVEVEPLPTS
jgi:predicted transcriptional regulator